MSYPTPNMNLLGITIGVDSGLTIEQNYNANVGILDDHNHASGNGVQITPSGLNINAALPFNNQQATSLQAAVFSQQTSLTTLNALFVETDGNLYFNDGSGDPSIQITLGGAVNATSSGIGSGTATASFVSSSLVVNEATNTPANIKAGSILIGQNVASSNYVTLSPPSSVSSASYALVLPAIPGSLSFMTMDSSGNMGTSSGVSAAQITSGSITGSQMANGTVTATQIASGTITTTQISATAGITNAQLAGPNTAISTSLTGSTSSLSFQNQGGQSITTIGRPVRISLQSSSSNAYVTNNSSSSVSGAELAFFRGASQIATYPVFCDPAVANVYIPVSAFSHVDTPSAGSNTYSVQIKAGGGTIALVNAVMFLEELS